MFYVVYLDNKYIIIYVFSVFISICWIYSLQWSSMAHWFDIGDQDDRSKNQFALPRISIYCLWDLENPGLVPFSYVQAPAVLPTTEHG